MTVRPALAALLAALAMPAAAIGHRADLAIFDRATGTELSVHWHEGRAYVVGRPGNEYQVIVRNRRYEDVLAVVSVDGVNVVNGETASPHQSGYVLSPWERLDVRGWRKSMRETAAFYFTSLGDSYAARTGRPTNVGVIGVALFNRKPRYEDLQPYRPRSRLEPLEKRESAPYAPEITSRANTAPPPPTASAPGASADATGTSESAQHSYRHAPAPQASAPLGTGHGRREDSHARQVTFERATDHPIETIVIHYDSYRNLVAQGVLQPQIARRNPDPFPMRFTPDP